MASPSFRGKQSPDDFANFQQGFGNRNGNGDYYDDEMMSDEDVEIDFEPQNGYGEVPAYGGGNPGGAGSPGGGGKKPKQKAMKEPRGRDPVKMPKVDIKGKFTNMGDKMKKARMPSPHELQESYLNSAFHKSFKQPLAVRTRIEDPAVQMKREAVTKQLPPALLGNMRHPLDIPLPKMKGSANPKPFDAEEGSGKENEEPEFDPKVKEGGKLYNTLPRSWRTQNLVTSVREMNDPDELAARKNLVETKSPSELASITSFSDIPVPSKIKGLMSPSEKVIAAQKSKKSADAVDEGPKEFSLYGTLPRSMRETKLVCAVREIDDEQELQRRRDLVESRTPTQLAQIGGLSDMPVPTRIEGLFKKEKRDRSGSVTRSRSEDGPRTVSGTLYATLPKSWKEQNLITQVKVEADPEELARRQELTKAKTPAQLAQISSLSDMPIPTAVENFLKKGGGSKQNGDTESKPITKMNMEDMYNNLPRSLKQDLLVSVTVEEDPEVLAQKKELCKARTPKELSTINGLDDFPLPEKIETLVRPGKRNLKRTSDKDSVKRSKSWSELATLEGWKNNMPESLKSQVLVKAVVEDPEVQRRHAEITKERSVKQLSMIGSMSDFPVPDTIENLLNKEKRNANKAADDVEDVRPMKEKLYDTLPRSMKSDLLVKARVEEPDIQKARQELTRSKSPVELSQINSLAEFPIPKTVENLMAKKSVDADGPEPPPRRFKKEDIYESLPGSLKTELQVRTKIETDEETLNQRRELTRSKSPVQLSEIRGVEDFPIPTFVENLSKKKLPSGPSDEGEEAPVGTMKKMYNNLPASLKTEVLVRARQEDPEIRQARAETVKAKSVNELSQINSIDEFPLPKSIDQMIGRAPRPVERRKRFREKQRSLSVKSMTDMLPESLKTQVLVKSRVEDPEVRAQRKELTESKSVSELSQVTSLSDFPIPTTLERLMSKRSDVSSGDSGLGWKSVGDIYATLPSSLKTEVMVRSRVEDTEVQRMRKEITQSKSVSELSQVQTLADFPIPTTIERLIQKPEANKDGEEKPPMSPARLQENIYATLPKSLKSEVLVRSRVESPEVMHARQELTQSKSVNELSQVNSLSDFPVPKPIENLIQGKSSLLPKSPVPPAEGGQPAETGESGSGYNIYASLPRSLKKEVLVRSKVEEDEEVLKERQAIVESKSPAELSQIHSFAEVPLPRRVEAWLHQGEDGKPFGSSGPPTAKSFHELSAGVYGTLPRSLKEPTLVRSKVEDPETQKERYELTRSKTPSQLAEMHTLGDIPIPGLWEGDRGRASHRTSLGSRSSSIPRNKQELKDLVYNRILPESLTKPCVVRCRTEDPNTLKKRQEIQQTKSIHELSKIRNVNEFPIPIKNARLPDIPLPSMKSLIGVIARTPKRNGNNKSTEVEMAPPSDELGYTPASTPHDKTYTDDEMLRYEMSSPEGSQAHREQDFGYEVIEVTNSSGAGFMPTQLPTSEEESSISVADHYKGTPPLRSKKKGKNRHSHEIPSDYQLSSSASEAPPLPPKRNPMIGHFADNDDDPQFLSHERLEPRQLTDQDISGTNGDEMIFVSESDFHAAGPKIAYSYQNDPKTTPMRKISSSSASQKMVPDETAAPPIAPKRSSRERDTPGSAGRLSRPGSGASGYRNKNELAKSASMASTGTAASEMFVSARSTLMPKSTTTDDDTLADSLMDSMHSAADTLIGSADTLDDEEYFGEMMPRDRRSK